MQPVSILYAALFLSMATYQLQSASASPFTRANPLHMQALSVSALVEDAEDFVQVRLQTKRSALCITAHMKTAALGNDKAQC